MTENRANNLPMPVEAPLRNKTGKALAVRQSEALSSDYVAHLDVSQVKRLADAAGESRRGERDRLLIQLPPNEWSVLLCVIRKTWGFNKKVDRIANFQIMNSTGLGKEVVSRALHNLHKKRVITRDGKFIGINKDYSQWKLAKQLTNKLAELLTELAESSTKVSSPHVTQKKKETIQNKDIYIGDGKNGKDRQSAERPRTGGKTNVRRSIGAPLR